MIVAIMQPYFFPYIGYFQLMQAVDAFVFYDDVQYMKGGWINRNRISMDDESCWLTLPVRRDSIIKHINQRFYMLGNTVDSLRSKVQSSYTEAPHFVKIFPFIDKLLHFEDSNVAHFNINSLRKIAELLNINSQFISASEICQSSSLRGESRVIDFCLALGADHYINAIGGVDLYDPKHFAQAGLRLSFLRSTVPAISFRNGEGHLSIIDTLMRIGWDGARSQVDQYEIGDKEQLTTLSLRNSPSTQVQSRHPEN